MLRTLEGPALPLHIPEFSRMQRRHATLIVI
jgi:hypothetical protein